MGNQSQEELASVKETIDKEKDMFLPEEGCTCREFKGGLFAPPRKFQLIKPRIKN